MIKKNAEMNVVNDTNDNNEFKCNDDQIALLSAIEGFKNVNGTVREGDEVMLVQPHKSLDVGTKIKVKTVDSLTDDDGNETGELVYVYKRTGAPGGYGDVPASKCVLSGVLDARNNMHMALNKLLCNDLYPILKMA